MAAALRLVPALLIAAAVDAAAARPMGPSARPQSLAPARIDEPAWKWRHPVLEHHRFQEDSESWPGWTLPFDAGADEGERERRGVTFSVRPGRGLKARAKLRF